MMSELSMLKKNRKQKEVLYQITLKSNSKGNINIQKLKKKSNQTIKRKHEIQKEENKEKEIIYNTNETDNNFYVENIPRDGYCMFKTNSLRVAALSTYTNNSENFF